MTLGKAGDGITNHIRRPAAFRRLTVLPFLRTMEPQSNMTTVFKLLAIIVNVAVIAIILFLRSKDADHGSQSAAQKQEPPE